MSSRPVRVGFTLIGYARIAPMSRRWVQPEVRAEVMPLTKASGPHAMAAQDELV